MFARFKTTEREQDMREERMACHQEHFFGSVDEIENSMLHNETHFLIVNNIQEIMENVRNLEKGSEFARKTRVDAIIRACTQMTRKFEDYSAEEFDREEELK